jgi:DHA2 family multidrug resistance protein-like MFS transporter
MGALILSQATWPWLFAVNLPVGAAALAASRSLPPTRRSPRHLDLGSMALSAALFGALVTGAETAFASPWLATASTAIGVVALIALVRREWHKREPLIPIDLLRAEPFRLAVAASTLCFAGQTAGLVALSFNLQTSVDQSALAAGVTMSAWPLSVAATATVSGRLADRFPSAWLCAVGAALLAAGLAAVAVLPPRSATCSLVVSIAVCGVGFGLFNVPNNRTMFLSAPPERSAAAGGLQGTARLSGQTAGAALMAAPFTAMAPDLAPRIGLVAAALLSTMAGLVSLSRAAPARLAGR